MEGESCLITEKQKRPQHAAHSQISDKYTLIRIDPGEQLHAGHGML